jgi:hydroxymethylpyrimidine pyrophosphatase-like HAD family hydrolase
MIKLFVLDIDGCISYAFRAPDWKNLSKLRDYNEKSRTDSAVPAITICSGRPQPYVESVAQMLDVDYPAIFESGGGMYTVKSNELRWHPFITDELMYRKEQLALWVEKELIPAFPGMIREFTKKTDVGLISSSEDDILRAYDRITRFVSENYPDFEVHHTEVSVNVIVRNCNKGEGLRQLSDLTGIPLMQMAYIGDSSGDIEALKIVGRAFAPANATSGVKKVAEVMQGETSDAIISAYEKIIESNLVLAETDN